MAVITASAAGGAWNTNGAWVGGVQPSAADDVLLTAASGNIQTAGTPVARSLDATTYTGTLTLTTGITLTLGDAGAPAGGSILKLVAGMTVTVGSTTTSRISFVSTNASTQTITTAGKTVGPLTVGNAGSNSAVYQLTDALALGAASITHTSSTFDTNGQTITAAALVITGSVARTLTLGASNITLSAGGVAWSAATVTNLTMTANTATATLTGASPGFNGATFNWNGLTLVFTGPTLASITGANTFANLTRTGNAAIDSSLQLSANQTVTGTLTLTGNGAQNRLWVQSNTPGTARTLTVGTTVTASRVDFEDIVGAGAASWNLAGITDGSGDCGGNSGITFTTPATKFGVGTGAANWFTNSQWSLTSGGAAGAPYPLPQDNVVLNASTGAASNYSMNMMRHCADLTCTGFTGTLSLTSSVTVRYIFGSMTLGSGMTLSVTGNFTLAGRGSHTVDMAGKAFTPTASRVIGFGRFGGTYTLTADANFGATTANTTSGVVFSGGVTFNAAGFNVTTPRVLTSVTGGSPTVNMGSGIWSITGTGSEVVWTGVGTINASTSTIVIANASAVTRTFDGGGKTYYDLTYTVAGSTGALTLAGSNTFHDFNFSDASNARTLVTTQLTTQTFTGNFNVFGTAGKLMTLGSNGSSNYIFSKASGIVNTVDYVDINRSTATGGATWYAGSHSVNNGANTGWIFTAAPSSTGNMFLLF